MAKKKIKGPKPFCWYCEREFDDDAVLIQHQKAKHFKCPHCPKRLITISGLRVHVSQVHKMDLESVPNALPNRGNLDIEIFGMAGVPEQVIRARQSKIIEMKEQEERHRAERIAKRAFQQKQLAAIVATLRSSQQSHFAYPKIKLGFAQIERELNEQSLKRNLQTYISFKRNSKPENMMGNMSFPPFPPPPFPHGQISQ